MLILKVFFCLVPTLTVIFVNCGTVFGNVTVDVHSSHYTTRTSLVPGQTSFLHDVYLNNNFSVSYVDPNVVFGIRRNIKNKAGLTVYSSSETSNTTTNITIYNGTCTIDVNINISSCPPGFSNINRRCQCDGYNLPVIKCDNSSFVAKIFVGFCVSEQESHRLLITHCPLAIIDHLSSVYTPLHWSSNGSLDFCGTFHRGGKLCGKCIKNRGISVYSNTFKCIECEGSRWKDIVKYVAIETIPVTVFFLFVLYFHIKITSGPVNGFIFFAQAAVAPFEVIYLKYIVTMFFMPLNQKYLPDGMVEAVIIPYSIWNLDFNWLFGHPSLCLSKELRAIDVLALRYVSTFYPLVLLLISYVIIELQAMNVRPVLWMLKIVCFPCMRWRRVWKAKISILDAFATYVLLSYSKVMYVTILFLSRSKVSGHSQDSAKYVLSFDPTIQLYSKEHLPYLFLAIAVLLTYGLFPPLLLTFYQFKTCYSFLERLRLNRPGLEQFVLAFQQCYKDGSNGSGDRRFFAGLYFVFRLVLVLVMTVPEYDIDVLGYKIIILMVFAIVCATAQPYKKAKYTFIDNTFFFILATISGFQFYGYVLLQDTGKFSREIVLNHVLLFIPMLYMIMFVGRCLFMLLKNRDPNRFLLLNDNELKDTLTAGREGNREPVHIDISPRPSITRTEVSIAELSRENSECESDSETENSPLLGKKREMKIFSQHAATLSEEYRLARNT